MRASLPRHNFGVKYFSPPTYEILVIDFIHVKKNFTDKDILKDANFRVNKGERVGPDGAEILAY